MDRERNTIMLRKTSQHVHVAYDHTDTGNLTAENVRLCHDGEPELIVDLSRNVGRGKHTDHDACHLQEHLDTLSTLRLRDDHTLKQFDNALGCFAIDLQDVRLRIDLGTTMRFRVRWASDGRGLTATVFRAV